MPIGADPTSIAIRSMASSGGDEGGSLGDAAEVGGVVGGSVGASGPPFPPHAATVAHSTATTDHRSLADPLIRPM
jgi:hypothetical protein